MPQLGLVCQTESQDVRYRTITRTRMLSLPPEDRAEALIDLYVSNLGTVRRAAHYCAERNITLYRLPTGLLPFSDHDAGRHLVRDPRVASAFGEAREAIEETRLRVVSHPDQYVVLSSERSDVVENAIAVLEAEARVMDGLGLPRSSRAAMILHGGKGGRARELVATIERLSDSVRPRLVLENDERSYGAAAILEICRKARVPMVFDAHHHLVKERLASYDDPSVAAFTQAAAATWPDPGDQLVHISNGRESPFDRRHSDVIAIMPSAFRNVPYIEVEAKAKERAIDELRAWFPPKKGTGKR